MPFDLVYCQLRFCFVLYFSSSCIFVIIICFFKAASLDGHMAFLVAVHYVIFLLVLFLYASLENKFFFFFFFFVTPISGNSVDRNITIYARTIQLKWYGHVKRMSLSIFSSL